MALNRLSLLALNLAALKVPPVLRLERLLERDRV
jgi:hypothetical protein